MSARRFFLDRSACETRAVVTLDGRAERLLIAREDEEAAGPSVGERYRARVRRFEPSLATAFLELGEGREAVLAARPGEAGAKNGQALTVEIKSEARAGRYLKELSVCQNWLPRLNRRFRLCSPQISSLSLKLEISISSGSKRNCSSLLKLRGFVSSGPK